MDYIERITSEENDLDHNVKGDAEEGPIVCVSREEVLQALDEVKTGKAAEPSEVSLELIAASRGVGIQVMAEVCRIVLYGFGMPIEWALSIVLPIFKGKGEIKNFSCYRAMKFLEHGMKVVKRVLEKSFVLLCLVMKCKLALYLEKDAGTVTC